MDRRLFTSVAALMGPGPWWAQFATSVIYVSNAASNGYGLGNDTTGTGTKAAPYLTIDKAQTIAADGTAIDVNPSGIDYLQNSSATGYLQVPAAKALAIGCDPALGQAVLKCTGSVARVVFFSTSAKKYVLYNLAIDGTGTSSGSLVTTANNTVGGITFQRCNFRNSTGSAIVHPTGNANVIVMIGCNFEASCHFVLSATGGNYDTLSMQGNAFAQDNQVYKGAVGSTVGLLEIIGNTFVPSAAGTTLPITPNGETITTLTFNSNVASGSFGSAILNIQGSSVISSMTANYNTGSLKSGMINCGSENVTTGEIAYNVLTASSDATSDPITARLSPATVDVHHNALTILATQQVHGMVIGGDGYSADNKNTTSTTLQALGQALGNSYVGQLFTMAPSTAANKASNIACVLVTLRKVGSPTGVISAALYTNNAGVPGTLIETSTTTVAGNDPKVTTSPLVFGFQFPGHYLSAPSGTYFLVLQYTGTVNGTDYINLSSNTTVTGGSLSTSTLGTVWTNDATHALIYEIDTGSFKTVAVNVYNNVVNVDPAASLTTHGLMVGAVNVTAMYRNQVYGSGIGLLSKNSVGGLFYDNIAYDAVGSQATMYFKGSFGWKCYQNTFVQASQASNLAATVNVGSNSECGVNAPISTGEIKNNILVNTGIGAVYSVDVGGVPGVTISNNDVYNGPSSFGIERNAYPTWGAWQAAGKDTSSVNANPLLSAAPTTPAAFVPPSNSPAGGIGANLQAFVPTDFNGAAFSTTPPAGAFNLAP